MELSRRDALVALAAAGVAGAAGATLLDDDTSDSISDDACAVLVAVAETVYPTEAEGVASFVETYAEGRLDDADRREGVVEAAADLDATARDWRDAPFADLDRQTRDQLLRDLGIDTADPAPDGTVSNRIRFYLVNELLYAFYASPTGGRLVGIENPAGYPGGTESYQRAQMEDSDG